MSDDRQTLQTGPSPGYPRVESNFFCVQNIVVFHVELNCPVTVELLLALEEAASRQGSSASCGWYGVPLCQVHVDGSTKMLHRRGRAAPVAMDANIMQESITSARARARKRSEMCGNENCDEEALCARQRQKSDPNPEKTAWMLAHKAEVHGHERRHGPTTGNSKSDV